MIKYKDYIDNILKSRPNEHIENVYMEKHHIIPRCMGGSNDKSNLIYLYPKEHFTAHKLLCNENPSHNGLRYAFWNMCQCLRKGRYKPSPEEYEQFKIEYIKSVSGENSPHYGKHRPEEVKLKVSLANKGRKPSKEHIEALRIINSKPFTEEHKRKISQTKKNQHLVGDKCVWFGRKHTEETKNKMRENMLGINNPNYGKKLSIEEKRKRGKMVQNIDTGKIFYTMKEATEYYNINDCSITACLHGRQKTAGGYHWKYFKEN